jgi:hypothetical protein
VLAYQGTLAVLNTVNPQRAPKPPTTDTAQKQPIPPRVYAYGRRRLHPYYALFDTAKNGTSVDVYAFADGQADGIEQVYLNDDKASFVNGVVQPIDDGKYGSNKVKAGWTLGAATNVAFANIVALLPGVWTNNHRGDGVVTGYLTKDPAKVKDYAKVYPQGDAVAMSLVARWQLCFDPRDNSTKWTENPVLQLMHYLTVRRGYDYNTRIVPTLQYWIDAANICDEAIPLKADGTEPRYRSCVSYDAATAQPKEVIGSLVETFDGWIAPRGDGAIVIYAGKLYTPTVTIGPDEIHSYNLKANVEDENRVDQLTVTYISEAHDWNEVETTPWGGENGAARTDSLSPQTPSHSQNRRLAKRKFSQINAPKRGSVTTNLGGRKARAQRYVYLDLREGDYDPLLGVPVVEITSLSRNMATGGVSFDWLIVDQSIDQWVPAIEEGEPAAVGDKVQVEPIEAPVLITAMARFSNVGESSGTDDPVGGDPQSVSGARLLLAASGPSMRDDLTWFAQTRVGTEPWSSLQEYPDADPGPGVSLLTGFVPYGANVQSQVFYSQGDGRLSPGSNILTTNTTKP